MITRCCCPFVLVGACLLMPSVVAAQAESSAADEALLVPNHQAAQQKADSRGRARVRALAALAGLVLLGFSLVAATWIGGRMTRRYMKSGDRAPVRPVDPVFTDDWASKPLTPEERARLDSSEW